jgi:Flp pilus assembly protein TadG
MALAAISLLALILAVGLCVDISHFYLVRTELQNAADAAALAGASALNSNPSGIELAVQRAMAEMNRYEFNNIEMGITEDNVTFSSELNGTYVGKDTAKDAAVAPSIRFVRVQLDPKAVDVFFSVMALGSATVDLRAEATAGMSPPLNYICQLAPLSVAQCETDPTKPYYDPACALDTTCTKPGATREFVKGCTYTIKLEGGSKISPGNYLILAFDGSGGSTVREGVASGRNLCRSVGQIIETEPGAKTGPVSQGINVRFNEYAAGLDPKDYPPDTDVYSDPNFTYDQYTSAGRVKVPPTNPDDNTRYAVDGRRVIIVPVVTAGDYENGRDTVKVVKFAAFFLRTKASNGNSSIVAEYIEDRVISEGGWDATGATGDPSLTKAVLYK